MSRHTVVWDARASLELLRARARLGPMRAAQLDAALEHARERLSDFPRIGGPAPMRGGWSDTIRRLLVGDTGYQLFYRLVGDGVVFVLSIRHEKQRPPKL